MKGEASFLKSKRKIGLYLAVETNAGGMFQYAQSILIALSKLDKSKYEIVVAYSDVEWANVLKKYNIEGHLLLNCKIGTRISNFFMAIRLSAKITRIISAFINPLITELKHLNCELWIFPAQESLSYQVPFPAIGTIHDLMHRYEPQFPEVSSGFRHLIREHRFKNISKFSKAILVDSEVGRSHVVESYATESNKIFVLPYVAPSYIYEEKERHDFDIHYKLPNKFYFYPAQFWQHKNHIRLLDALKLSLRQYPDMSLVFSGGKLYEYEKVLQYCRDNQLSDNVHFVGYVPYSDMRGFYKRARALVMPTFFGPTNIPPLEALICGCPIIVSRIYAMPEQLGDVDQFILDRKSVV